MKHLEQIYANNLVPVSYDGVKPFEYDGENPIFKILDKISKDVKLIQENKDENKKKQALSAIVRLEQHFVHGLDAIIYNYLEIEPQSV